MSISKRIVKNILLTAVLCLWVLCVFLSIPFIGGIFNPPTPALMPTLDASYVEGLCQRFALDSHNPFCAKLSGQNMNGFEAALRDKFPVGQTVYQDIVSYFKDWPARSADCIDTGKQYNVSYCPMPDKCNTGRTIYVCYFGGFSTGVQIGIWFDRLTGKLNQLTVLQARYD